jgi:hypothetical protein
VRSCRSLVRVMEFSRELMVGSVSPEDSVGSYNPHLTITAKGTVQCNVVLLSLKSAPLMERDKSSEFTC